MAGPSVIQVASTDSFLTSGVQTVNGPDGATPIDWLAETLYLLTTTHEGTYTAAPTLSGLTSPDYSVITKNALTANLSAYLWTLIPSVDEAATVSLDYSPATTGKCGAAAVQIVGAEVGAGASGVIVQSVTGDEDDTVETISVSLATFADRGNLAYVLAAISSEVPMLQGNGWVQSSVVPSGGGTAQLTQWALRDPADPLLRTIDPPKATWDNGVFLAAESVIIAVEIAMQTSGA